MANAFKKWTGSPIPGTIGLEGEFYLIWADTGLLADEALTLLRLIWTVQHFAPLRLCVTPEFYACMIELKTNGGLHPSKLPGEYQRLLMLLMEAAEACGLMLLPVAHYRGTDEMWRNRPHFTDPGGPLEEVGVRYARLLDSLPAIQLEPRIPGNVSMQPHVGLPLRTRRERRAAVAVCDVLSTLGPTLAAVGGNSPDACNPDSDSERLSYWNLLPRSGPYLAHSFDRLRLHAWWLRRRGLIQQNTEMWYSGRINQFSVELRMIDMQPTLPGLLSMSGFVHCLGMGVWEQAMNGRRFRLPPLAELEVVNLSDHTLQRPDQVPFWDLDTGRWTTLSHRFEWLAHLARTGVRNSGQGPLLNYFESWAMAGQNGAAQMRRLFAEHDTPEEAYLAAAHSFQYSAGSLEMMYA